MNNNNANLYVEYMRALDDRSLAFKACAASGQPLKQSDFFVEADARVSRLAKAWSDYLKSVGC